MRKKIDWTEVWQKQAAKALAKELEDARLTEAIMRRDDGKALMAALDAVGVPHDHLKAGTVRIDGWIFQVVRTPKRSYWLRMGKPMMALRRKNDAIPAVIWSHDIADMSDVALAIIELERESLKLIATYIGATINVEAFMRA